MTLILSGLVITLSSSDWLIGSLMLTSSCSWSLSSVVIIVVVWPSWSSRASWLLIVLSRSLWGVWPRRSLVRGSLRRIRWHSVLRRVWLEGYGWSQVVGDQALLKLSFFLSLSEGVEHLVVLHLFEFFEVLLLHQRRDLDQPVVIEVQDLGVGEGLLHQSDSVFRGSQINAEHLS